MLVLLLLLPPLPLAAGPPAVRVATFNTSLNRATAGRLAADLASPGHSQARRIAEIIQRVAPDVILLNEFDHDTLGPGGASLALQRFHDNFLRVPQNGQPALEFPHRFTAPVNTGLNPATEVGRGFDFDNNGVIVTQPGSEAYGNDCYGFGLFPGQYGMAVLSRLPVEREAVRTFQKILWKELPDPLWPDRLTTPEPQDWYSPEEKEIFRLSSKSHWDLPLRLEAGGTLHLLASHPTPPVFDGAEDRNGRRNFEEIRFWKEHLSGGSFIRDDAGGFGGLPAGRRFVIVGDLNADPVRGDSFPGAIRQLLEHPRVNPDVTPGSGGFGSDTADFSSGRLRVDYVLPSREGWAVTGSGVFWPRSTEPGGTLVSASDHRLVWMDLLPVPVISRAVRELSVSGGAGRLQLSWLTEAGVAYQVQSSADLRQWEVRQDMPVIQEDGVATAVDASPGAPAAFYRISAWFP